LSILFKEMEKRERKKKISENGIAGEKLQENACLYE
jgi:hypothetical protein